LYGSDKRAAFAFFFFLPLFCDNSRRIAAIASPNDVGRTRSFSTRTFSGFVFGGGEATRTVA
jgi:hypothetical protein